MGKLTPKNMTDKELERAAKDTQILSEEQRQAAADEYARRRDEQDG